MSAEFIRASAGSGKTYQLSGRYLGILLRGLRAGQPVDPGKILATTFTRAAAGEILQRVLLRLSLAALDAGERTRLGQSAHCDLLTAEECRQALAHLAQKPASGPDRNDRLLFCQDCALDARRPGPTRGMAGGFLG